MTDSTNLARLLRSALPPVSEEGPSRDLWLSIRRRRHAPDLPFLDLGLAAAVAAALSMVPEWLWLLAYHL